VPGRYYTQTVWTVKTGHEEEFVTAWERLAARWIAAFDEAGPARLLQDTEHANRFVGYGDWETLEAIAAMSGHPEVRQAAEELEALVESVEPHTLELRAMQS
jgi:hypothetical protein